MTALTSAVAIGDNQLLIDTPLAAGQVPGWVKIDSEMLNVGGQHFRTGTTLVLSEPAKATHSQGATVTYAGNPFDPTFVAATAGEGGAAEPGTVVVTDPPDDIEDALNGAASPSAANVFATIGDTALVAVLTAGNDASGLPILGLLDPVDEQDAATKAYVDLMSAPPSLAEVLLGSAPPETPGAADGNDTGGVGIVHAPAVDVEALAWLNAIGTGTGDAFTRPLAQVEDGNAVAGPRAEATGDGNTDACTYARSVDGDALADNDAAATGAGGVDAGCYAAGVDGVNISSALRATATGSGNAFVDGIATVNTGIATAGSTAVSPMGTAGMQAIADGTSARTGFFGTTPIVRPEIPASPTAAQVAAVLVALGLATQGV